MIRKRLPNSPMAGVSISIVQKITLQLADHIFRERDFTGVGKEFLWGLRKNIRLWSNSIH